MKVWRRVGTMALIAALLLAPATVPAGEQARVGETEKDLCLLDSESCPDRKDDILQIIERLKREIAKGEKVYTLKEIKRLERKLEDYEFLLWMLLYGPND
ncbi:MAG: hypothetical protein NDI77_05205 [Geobacteraceae bacterium]|nr:hypothetical protein [Geobacteraceae bacterium]